MEESFDKKIENIERKFSKFNIIYLVVTLILCIITLVLTKNLLYFIFAALLSIAIYFIISKKDSKIKKRVSAISTIVSGTMAGFSLFTYFYTRWILPFMGDLLSLPALDKIKELQTELNTIADIFLIIGLVFLTVTIAFVISYIVFKKKVEKNLVLENM